ncbi:hypothetical protein [Roseovarius sp. M141]|uniref:hypothetical protein n=1 Tax=Roseovarius sp. M141 TaxID=2583806 RepID=UPI0020CFA77B|nr:hypothetical protein [Roseovarius sp. M141]MCQ0093035.1 hypothetical protein [Roseovarius sp. M141]
MASDELPDRIAQLLADVDLDRHADAVASDLPLACAIIHRPDMLIPDALTSEADPVARDEFR